MNYLYKNIIELNYGGANVGKKIKIEKEKKKEKWHLFGMENISEEYIKGPHIEILGNKKITIDGCYGVFEYKDTYLKLRLQRGSLILCGEGFDIVFFENSLMTVKGKITSVEFCV